MSKSILVPINMNKNEVQNVRLQNLATAPSNPVEGQLYYNSGDNKAYLYNGTAWIDVTAQPTSGTTDYSQLSNKPVLKSDNTTAQEAKASETINETINLHKVSKTGNYEDLNNKPTIPSTAQDVGAIASSEKGTANGVATLGSDGKVPTGQLPSYVDDVVEYASLSNFPSTGETGKIYVALDTNKAYRWSGSTYVEIAQATIHKYVGTIEGDGATTSYAITHGLNSKDVIVNVYDNSTNEDVIVDITRTSTNAVTIGFAVAPSETYKVVIIA